MQFDRNKEFASEEIKDFINYFERSVEVNSRNKERYIKEINLEKAMEIYNGDLDDINKSYELAKLYKNGDVLRKTFTKFRRYTDDKFLKTYLSKVEEMASFLDRHIESGSIKKAKDAIIYEEHKDSIPVAKKYIEKYVKSGKIFTKDFLLEADLSKEKMDYYSDIVGLYDKELFDRYKKRMLENSKERRYNTRDKIRELYNGITTGFVRFGEKFDMLKCYELLPFTTVDNLNELLEDFDVKKKGCNIEQKTRSLMETVEKDKANTVYSYLIKNRIITQPYNFTTESDIRKETLTLKDGKSLSDEDKEIIIKYLNVRQIPLFSKAVTLVRDKVLNNEIFLDQEKHLCIRRSR